MVETDRESGHLTAYPCIQLAEDVEEFNRSIEEGTLCSGCEVGIEEDTGVECYCVGEGYSRTHKSWKWCSDSCLDSTHEVPIMFPEDWPYDR